MRSSDLKNVIYHLVALKNALTEHQEVFDKALELLLEDKPKQFKANVIEVVGDFNKLLKSNIQQAHKATITITIETLLTDTNQYNGFNNNYWLKQGCGEWRNSEKPEGKGKEKFIIGPDGHANVNNDDFVDEMQGEYSRNYYIKEHSPKQYTH